MKASKADINAMLAFGVPRGMPEHEAFHSVATDVDGGFERRQQKIASGKSLQRLFNPARLRISRNPPARPSLKHTLKPGDPMPMTTEKHPHPEIRFSKLGDEAPLPLCCPGCGTPRLLLAANGASVPGGGHWLTDGDRILGLLPQLIQAGKEPERPRDFKHNFDYALLVGDCPRCGQSYFVIQALFIDAEVDEPWVDTYFRENADRGRPANFKAFLPGGSTKEWATQQFDTPKGTLQHHLFGPFALTDDGIRGPYGVCGCSDGGQETWSFAGNLLLELWDELKLAAECANANR